MKIYILGDSFTDNLFQNTIKEIEKGTKPKNGVSEYITFLRNRNLPDPLHFSDYLKLWGYDVINLGKGGCSNNHIYRQFTKIKEPFDRIIVNYTALCRFEWYEKNINVRRLAGGIPPNTKLNKVDEILIEQGLIREEHLELKKETLDFISFFNENYKEKQPIIWAPFPNIKDLIKEEKGFFLAPDDNMFKEIIPEFDKLTISNETKGKINDNHYGRYGNYYAALIFDTILKNTYTEYPILDLGLFLKIKERIKTEKHNIKDITFETRIL